MNKKNLILLVLVSFICCFIFVIFQQDSNIPVDETKIDTLLKESSENLSVFTQEELEAETY